MTSIPSCYHVKESRRMKHNLHAKQGFTLVELLLGMTILALVVGSAFAMLDAASTTYRRAIKSMEINQSARIGLRRVTEELRFSLSANAFWQPSTQIQALPQEQVFAMMQGPVVQERDPGKIIFKGESDSVVFVRKVYQFGARLPFDLQECRIHVDQNEKQLLLTVQRSLLMVKQMAWWYQIVFETSLNGFTFANAGTTDVRYRPVGNIPDAPPLEMYIGDYGTINRSYLLAENVSSIKFRYRDTDGIKTSWDSSIIVQKTRISRQSPTFNPLNDISFSEKGPPQVVDITLEISNGEVLVTATDIPAGMMTNSGRGAGGFGNAPPPNANRPPPVRNESQVNVPNVSSSRTLMNN